MTWSKEWPKPKIEWPDNPFAWPKSSSSMVSQAELKSDNSSRLIAHDGKVVKSQGSNLVDDQAYLYFQCEGCGEILDPYTKSFAKLQEHRVSSGWKCVWNLSGMGYTVYCAKCEEKV